MGVFYTTTKPAVPALQRELSAALAVNPSSIPDIGKEAADRAVQLAQTLSPQFNAVRFLIALAIAAALLLLAIWTGKHELPDISKDLMNSFAGYSGLILGMLGGEAQKSVSG